MLLKDKLKPYRLLLASQSPRRRELMTGCGLPYELAPKYECEEVYPAGMPGEEVPLYLSRLKSEAYPAALAPNEILLTADTVVISDGEVLGKPHDAADARRMMRLLSGRTHRVHTGVCLAVPGRPDDVFACTSSVRFAALSEEEIEAYIATPEPYDKAGGYAVQGGAAKFVQGIEGCYHNIMGLPVSRVYAALKAAGIVKITQNQ